jgi:hypothetical protein
MRLAIAGIAANIAWISAVVARLDFEVFIGSRLDCARRQSDVSVHLTGRRTVMRNVSNKEREKLSAEIASLESLDLIQLRSQWKLLYEIEAPRHLSRDWLRRAVAYRIQENALGGLKPATRRLLERVAEDARMRKPSKVVPTRKVGPDTILIREWGGTRHEVTVVENGVMFRGKRYRSLSQVARMITGSQWSGPLFFGLKAPAKEAANGAR